MILIQAIAIILAALAISKSYLDYRQHREPLVMFLFWVVIWVVVAVFAVDPALIAILVSCIEKQPLNVNSIVMLGFIFLLYIVYRVYAKAARLEYRQTELIRRLALEGKINDIKK